MAVDTMPKVEAVTLSIRVPKDVKDRFSEAARIISEITPKKPVEAEDLISFTLFKEKTGEIVIDFLEFVHNCNDSILAGQLADRSETVSSHRSNGH